MTGKAKRKASKRAPRKRAQLDIRDVFLLMLNARFERGTPNAQAVQAVRDNPHAWAVFLAVRAASGGRTDRNDRLLAELRAVVDARDISVDERRVRFAGAVEAACKLYGAAKTETEQARVVDQIFALVTVERARRRGPAQFEFEEWQPNELREVGAALAQYRAPDTSKKQYRRGGKGVFGADAVAAALSRKLQLFGGDNEDELNDTVAERFKQARLRLRKGTQARTR